MIDRNTASGPNVHIIDTAFPMPQLGRYRRIWLYLPPEYASGQNHYPVLYMHDGQNLFENWSAFGEEWQVDETLDRMDRKCIVVGIDNGGEHRLREYNVNDHAELGKGEGRRYLSFIVETLKPFIDRTYRTKPGRAHTTIAGSSMGGLISYYAALLHPEVFGRAGVFSPSFWLQPSILQETKAIAARSRPPVDLYFYAGEQEGAEMAARVRAVTSLLQGHPAFRVQEYYNPSGTHSEAEWRAHFPEFYGWLMGLRRRSNVSA
ncbi:alpha/beta hydrolase [Flaviaesturariibacter amylovorans]|uniref:Alpha/beta hydrolase n=1 Tax=Flaviaesturariibacter amylovorans TaxID=1084520 RepID=A0ABP8GUE3_9BACT